MYIDVCECNIAFYEYFINLLCNWKKSDIEYAILVL